MMKLLTVLSVSLLLLAFSQQAPAQILDKIKNKTAETIEKVRDGKKEKAEKEKPDEKDIQKQNETSANSRSKETAGESHLLQYANYDFVTGDKVLFYYDMAGEKDSEIPGRLLISEGNAEIQTYKEDKVLFIPGNSNVFFRPQMAAKSFLPQQFTVEFDVLSNGGNGTSTDVSEIILYFRSKEEKSGAYGNATAPVRITLSAISGDELNAQYEFGVFKDEDWVGGGSKVFPPAAVNNKPDQWRKVAVYINNNIGKLYVDQHRIGISNQVEEGKPAFLDFEVNAPENPVMFKNFRIAAGGADAYNKVVTDGKFIAYGIQFDVNKSILNPSSMGTINEFVKMMQTHPDLKFEIGGHTDTDGNKEHNQQLSQQRADAVKSQMIRLGIPAERLVSKGYGFSKPLVENNSTENKAKNRRVEFVRL